MTGAGPNKRTVSQTQSPASVRDEGVGVVSAADSVFLRQTADHSSAAEFIAMTFTLSAVVTVTVETVVSVTK